jgi:N-terminal acetyltransferase B complex catalytic subunit
LGKVEDGEPKLWHGHVTALSVAPEYRRLGLARKLMARLEAVSDIMFVLSLLVQQHPVGLVGDSCGRFKGLFVDLFVRQSNKVAIKLYERLGYSIYRTIKNYYSGDVPENAHGLQCCRQCIVSCSSDMRKSLSSDPERKTMRPRDGPPIDVRDLDD